MTEYNVIITFNDIIVTKDNDLIFTISLQEWTSLLDNNSRIDYVYSKVDVDPVELVEKIQDSLIKHYINLSKQRVGLRSSRKPWMRFRKHSIKI